MEIPTLQALDKCVLDVLENYVGEKMALDKLSLRSYVSRRFGSPINDRTMRLSIENLRTNNARGAWICSTLKGGYFIAKDIKELEKFLDTEERRFKQIAVRISKQRKAAGIQAGGQTSFL